MPLSRSDAFMPSASQATASYVIKDKSSSASNSPSGDAICAVCGDGHAKLHYGVSFFSDFNKNPDSGIKIKILFEYYLFLKFRS